MDTNAVAVLPAADPVAAAVAAGLADRGMLVARLDMPGAAPAGISAVVDAGPLAQPPVQELATVGASGWQSQAEAPLRRALHVLRQAHELLVGGGAVVLLLPTAVTTGAAGMVPWVAAAEGYRSLAKAAARAWNKDGVTVNCVLVPSAGEVGSDLVGLVAALVGGDLCGVTGQTIAVDGGVWMTP